ncbi:hypothetical protein LM602_08380 [Candidatus Acetothermia bacterium]|nr:hypothetical protein [Candidatus Acetothermia bacterium]MCI2432541.1 hypothetical protein [Candidatus Acetothermia bacterium]MCI2436565.1 hypothetical protein [Candidatus Acetothermia bacterium]
MKGAIAICLCLLCLALFSLPANAQPLGIGVKVPLQAFVSLGITETLSLELGLPIGLKLGGVAAVANAKLFFKPISAVQLLWKPFVGVGVSARLRGSPTEIIIAATFFALLGIEVPLSPFSLFGEVWLYAGERLPGIFSLGARYDF